MKFEPIDKSRYRNHLNKVIIAAIVVLTGLSLGSAQLLIYLFPDSDGSHFHWNLSGVIFACIVIAVTLNKIKNKPFMYEVYYVWRLKQHLNLINRKQSTLKKQAAEGNSQSMQILHFYYQGLRKLWQLDDNTITMEELSIWQKELEGFARKYNVKLNKDEFDGGEL
ncbi:DUF3087 domain-containing protein [Catenovulum sediminis]|uniref:DUF3087 domain-containing protein n=1 Tax=Catenovulum sediminis TaxID=1740262 RepID=A0ABV1RIH7_9ALTE|nr:DUF3087 domain-containing protein [Catenovulum sediminis]